MGLKFNNENGFYEIDENYFVQVAINEINKINGVKPGKKEYDYVSCEIDKNENINLKAFIKIGKGLDLMSICPKVQESVKQAVKQACDKDLNRIDIEIVGFIND